MSPFTPHTTFRLRYLTVSWAVPFLQLVVAYHLNLKAAIDKARGVSEALATTEQRAVKA
jgi:hypothetical protein